MQRPSGFTLIELMVVVAIIGIIASIAYPSYTAHVRNSNRAIAKMSLTSIASRQENFRADRRQYATTLSALGLGADTVYASNSGELTTAEAADSVYRITLAAGATATAYTLTAVPIRTQSGDSRCGTLSLTSTGARSATGAGGSSCWK